MKRFLIETDLPESGYLSSPRRRRLSDGNMNMDTGEAAININYGPRPRYPKKKKATKPYSKKPVPFTAKVRNVINAMAETKFKSLGVENFQLFHNVGGAGGPVVYGNLLRTDSGSLQTQRVGDTVWGKYLQMRLWLSNKSDRTNIMYRILVISTPPDQVNTTNPVSLWKGFVGNRMLDYVNTDIYNVVYEHMLDVEAGDTSQEPDAALREISTFHKFTIPLDRKIQYQTDASGTVIPSLQSNCLSLVVIPYDAFGTLVTDNVASYAAGGIFCYKDF